MHPRCVDTRRAWRNRTTTALLTRATMRMNLPVTGRDVSISDTANILSTTDLNGDITYVNPDFIKISGFDEDELLGQHHNIVRHPDMPREAFADLWFSVRGGNSWMGMVKNRCKNGDHYWVSAFVTPISRNGRVVEYQSVRTKPQPAQIAAAEGLYAQLRDQRPRRRCGARAAQRAQSRGAVRRVGCGPVRDRRSPARWCWPGCGAAYRDGGGRGGQRSDLPGAGAPAATRRTGAPGRRQSGGAADLRRPA